MTNPRWRVTVALGVLCSGLAWFPAPAGAQCDPNAALEAAAQQIATAMGGYLQFVDNNTTQACPEVLPSTNCRDQLGHVFTGDGSLHHGLMYPCVGGWGFFREATACVTADLPTGNSHRGSDAIHEVMHLYLYRLQQKGYLSRYFQTSDGYLDEPLTRCMAKLYSAPISDGPLCANPNDPQLDQMRRDYSPYNSPRWW